MKKAGVKLSIVSIVSIASTQVAPRLHHLHKKEGQLDTFLIEHLSGFCRKFNCLDYNYVFSLVRYEVPKSYPRSKPQCIKEFWPVVGCELWKNVEPAQQAVGYF